MGCPLLGFSSSSLTHTHPPRAWRGEPCRTPCRRCTEWCQVRLSGNAGSFFTIFVENKPACPSGWGRRGRPGPGNAVAGDCPSQVAVSWLLPWRLSASPSCPRWRGRREWLRVCFQTARKLRKGSPAQHAWGHSRACLLLAPTPQPVPLPTHGFWGPLHPSALPGTVCHLSINTSVAYPVAKPDGGS